MPEKVGKEWVPDPSDAYKPEEVLRAILGPSAFEDVWPSIRAHFDTPDENLNEHINLGDT